MVTDYHHRYTERTEDSQRTLIFYYPLFHYPLEIARNLPDIHKTERKGVRPEAYPIFKVGWPHAV